MKILVVDDDILASAALIKELKDIMSDSDYEIFEANLPSVALEIADKYMPEIAFLDISMPEMNGIELAGKLKDIRNNINIIFVTAHEEYGLEAMNLHASGYILKPFTRADVKNELDNLRFPVVRENEGLRVVTFGNFDVYADGKPVYFSRSKAKEMFAYLVDRSGCSVSKRELASILFEEQEYSDSVADYTAKIAITLSKSLKDCGYGDVLIKNYNSYRIDTSKIICDRYAHEKTRSSNATNGRAGVKFCGEYMTQYPWAEYSLGRLQMKDEDKY
ncbi:MAG: response regulator [Lachnospiraceae bacterium]|nr:response regulator [Lachnospiraceae bacterium]